MPKKPHTEVVILGEFPECDLCRADHGISRPAKYDARIPAAGYWANVCPVHFALNGCKVGLGHGQKFVRNGEKK